MNQSMARRVLDYIESHPEEHSQIWFFHEEPCGTTRCIAGTAVYLDYLDNPGGYLYTSHPRAMGHTSTAETAEELLGLSGEESALLFYCMDDDLVLSALRVMADEGVFPTEMLSLWSGWGA